MEDKYYNYAVHLIGDQPFPNLIGLRDLQADRHLLLATEKTKNLADQLKEDAERLGLFVDIAPLSDPNDIDKIISEFVGTRDFTGKNVAVNLTGGTKPMAFAAMFGVQDQDCDADYFYYDTQFERRFHWVFDGSKRQTEETPFERLKFKRFTLNDFTTLFKYSVNPPDENYDKQVRTREAHTRKIWEFRLAITYSLTDCGKTLMQEAADLCVARNDPNNAEAFGKPVSISRTAYYETSNPGQSFKSQQYGNQTVEIDYEEGKGGKVLFRDNVYETILDIDKDWKDFPNYLGGKWFEEYVYIALKEMVRSKRLTEAQANVSLHSDLTPNLDMREFDFLATDGIRLYVGECKAGSLRKEHVQKLDQGAVDYGGVFGVGVLVAQKYQDESKSDEISTIKEEVNKSKNVYCFHGLHSVELLKEHMPDLGTPKGPKSPLGPRERNFGY